jgi:hypothetical protein
MRTAPGGVEMGSTIKLSLDMRPRDSYWGGGGVESSPRKVWTRLTSNTHATGVVAAVDAATT